MSLLETSWREHEGEEEASDEELEDTTAASIDKGKGKPGGGKNAKESSKNVEARKVQNRIAQREFRQRKQQYIRDLEAKVELLSSNKEDQVEQLRAGVKAVLEENKQLRQLLKGLAAFIGGGLPARIGELGLSEEQMNELLSRPDDLYARQAVNEVRLAKGMKPIETHASCQPVDPNLRPNKRKRYSVMQPGETECLNGTSPSGSTSSGGPQKKDSPAANGNGITTNGNNLYAARPIVPNGYPTVPLANSALIPKGSNVPNPPPPSTNALSWDTDGPKFPDVQPLYRICTDSPKLQAMQLISYHLQNKRNNPDYVLPPCFTPTQLQLTVPHDSFIDGIIWRDLRDRLIIYQQEGNSMTDLFSMLVENFQVHREDILDPASWELTEPFLKKYYYMIDQPLLDICNCWRKDRGEPVLELSDLVPSETEGDASMDSVGANGLSGQTPAAQLFPAPGDLL
ncbi:hypothetical protein BT69DRAFT_1352045 [Atractiella rhizophila]|nr:hypothetical protein BT69DRAFT_1352045 [Atractiella rhizophila]